MGMRFTGANPTWPAVRWSILAVVLLTLAVRLIAVAARTETGWDTIRSQWAASIEWTGWAPKQVGYREPPAQARFWLAETERILTEHPDSAALHMGAAWVLDSPDIGFLRDHVTFNDWLAALPSVAMELDDEAIAAGVKEFRDLCRERCLAAAARAVELEPDNVDFRRMQALLQVKGALLFAGDWRSFSPRNSAWSAVLEAGRERDPHNSLYDYLAAAILWEQSASREYNAQADLLEHRIADPTTYAEAQRRWAAGQQCELLAIGEAGMPAVVEFLEASDLPLEGQRTAAVSRLQTARFQALLVQLWRDWRLTLMNQLLREGDDVAVAAIQRQLWRMYEQAIAAPETSAMWTRVSWALPRELLYYAMAELASRRPDLLPPDELTQRRKRELQARVETAALKKFYAEQDAAKRAVTKREPLQELALHAACSAAGALAVAAVALLTAGRALGRGGDWRDPHSVWPHWVAWSAGLAISVFLLGVAPAGLVGEQTQVAVAATTLRIVFWVTLLSMAAYVVYRCTRAKDLRFSLRRLLAAMTAVAVAVALCVALSDVLLFLWGYATDLLDALWMRPRGYGFAPPEALANALSMTVPSWPWAGVQWVLYHGELVGPAVAAILLALWFWRRSRRLVDDLGEGADAPSRRRRAVFLCHALTRSLAAGAGCAFAGYLWLAPPVVTAVESEFQADMLYYRDPQSYLAPVLAQLNALQTEPQQSKEALAEAERQLSAHVAEYRRELAEEAATDNEELAPDDGAEQPE